MRAYSKSRPNIISVIVVAVVCAIAIGLPAYGFVADLATNAIASSIANAYENLSDLQRDISRAYPADSVELRFERHQLLIITLVNSTANQLPVGDQKTPAAEIARFAARNHRVDTTVRFIKIIFLERTRLLGVPLSHGNAYVFSKADLSQE
jgi:hypothetical protein